MTSENEKEDKPAGSSHEDRVKEIKKEEQEDASSYYGGGESKEPDTTEEDFNRPVQVADPADEEMSLVKAVAYLGFGMAAIAIVFILFFLRDLDERVISVDTALSKMDEKFIPFKNDVEKSISQVTGAVEQLKGKLAVYERMVAVMELKRALVSIQEVTERSSPEVKAKAGEVIASIQTLLIQLGEEPGEGMPTAGSPAAGSPAADGAAAAGEEAAPSAEAEPAAEEAAPEPSEETPVGQIELEESGESSETMAEAESPEASEDTEEDEGGGDEEEEEEEEEE